MFVDNKLRPLLSLLIDHADNESVSAMARCVAAASERPKPFHFFPIGIVLRNTLDDPKTCEQALVLTARSKIFYHIWSQRNFLE